jgi:hypothetical protein
MAPKGLAPCIGSISGILSPRGLYVKILRKNDKKQKKLTLKTLIINDSLTRDACPLIILAPTLAYLHLAENSAYLGGGISINEMPCLAKALIHTGAELV